MIDGKPYRGLKVIDASQGFAAPYCAGLLALYGADVIKIEPPNGDWARGIGRNQSGQTPLHIVGNRGKRSIALNLKKPEALAIAHRLAKGCDVFLESFRPGVSDRLGLSYKAIKAMSPDVLYLSVSGFGQDGIYRDRPATDTVLQAFSGLMSINKGLDGIPHRVGMLAVDTSAALHAFQALQAALYARRDGSGGRWIQMDLMRTTASFLTQKIAEYQMEDGQPRGMHPPAGAYQTKDGWLVFTLVKNEHFKRLSRALGHPELADDSRYIDFEQRLKNSAELIEMVTELMGHHTTAEWISRLHAEDVLSNSINTIGDWLQDEHVCDSGVVGRVEQPDSGPVDVPIIPGTVFDSALYAPAVGEHGAEILLELGMSSSDIENLAGTGAIKLP
jgi:crotonobetainyl-CoA:carnitine CoA-transferase CaiB-like acyl-CoA transferase